MSLVHETVNLKKIQLLNKHGIRVTVGYCAENIHGADLVAYTTAISEDHVKLTEAGKLGIPLLSRPQLLGQITEQYFHTVAISGTRGKTTATSMIAKSC